MRKHHRVGVLVASLLIAAGLVACGSSGGGNTSTSAPPANTSAVSGELQNLYRAAKAANQTKVVVYGPAVANMTALFDAFSKQFPGISVEGVPVFGPSLTQRINQEFASGKHVADMLFDGDLDVITYSGEHKLTSYMPSTAKGLSSQYIGPDNTFLGALAGPFAIAYNTNEISKADAPTSWRDLLEPRFKDKLVMEDPSHPGATSDVLMNLLYSGVFSKADITKLKNQHVALEATMSQAGTDTASGKYSVLAVEGLSFYQALKSKGAPLAYVFPLTSDNYLTANYVSIIKGAPHPDAAKLFESWVFTPAAQALLAKEGSYSTMPGAPAPSGYPQLSQIKQLHSVPLPKVGPEFNSSLKYFSQVFGGQ